MFICISSVHGHVCDFILCFIIKEEFVKLEFWETKLRDVNGVAVLKLKCRNLAIKANQTEQMGLFGDSLTKF